jgi:hypothetical protein
MFQRVRGAALFLMLGLGVALGAAAARPGLEGRWRLVEQRYGEGRSNLAGGDTPLWLEFAQEGARLTCRIWVADPAARAMAWPAPPAGGPAGPIAIEQLRIDAPSGRAMARYTARGAGPEPEVLWVIEDYALSTDGASLAGTVTVGVMQDGEPRGRYVLHRRFAREP